MSDQPSDSIAPEQKEIVDRANDIASDWARAINSEDYADAAAIAIGQIRLFRAEMDTALSLVKPQLSGLVVLFNGLRDIANLRLIIQRKSWRRLPKAIEKAWALAHDAKDRLFDREDLDPDFIGGCAATVNEVLTTVKEQFGNGLYNSWEMVFDRLACTICEQDIRACHHLGGEWYDGQLCQIRPEGGTLAASAIVENPRDPRCRIWPWHTKSDDEKLRIYGTLFVIFDLEGPADGGEVVDIDKLFPTVRTVYHHPHTNVRYEVYAYKKLGQTEAVKLIRDFLAHNKLVPKRGSRIRFSTLAGSDHQRHGRPDQLMAED